MLTFSHNTPYEQEILLRGGPLDGHAKTVLITDDQETITFMGSTYKLTKETKDGHKIYEFVE